MHLRHFHPCRTLNGVSSVNDRMGGANRDRRRFICLFGATRHRKRRLFALTSFDDSFCLCEAGDRSGAWYLQLTWDLSPSPTPELPCIRSLRALRRIQFEPATFPSVSPLTTLLTPVYAPEIARKSPPAGRSNHRCT